MRCRRPPQAGQTVTLRARGLITPPRGVDGCSWGRMRAPRSRRDRGGGTTWLVDDAYITFRTADNFVHRYGLTWNVSERVQAYTNPLWLFLFSACYWLTEEAYYTPIFLSIAVSLTAAAVLVRCIARSAFSALLCLSLLLSSKAFVDYSTSGLENPLTHLLLALFLSRLLTDEEGGTRNRSPGPVRQIGYAQPDGRDPALRSWPRCTRSTPEFCRERARRPCSSSRAFRHSSCGRHSPLSTTASRSPTQPTPS